MMQFASPTSSARYLKDYLLPAFCNAVIRWQVGQLLLTHRLQQAATSYQPATRHNPPANLPTWQPSGLEVAKAWKVMGPIAFQLRHAFLCLSF